jgi:hypothetical protein
MFSNYENYMFPDNVCGVPFMKGRYNPSTDDEKDDDTRESDETIGSHDTPVQEPLVDSHSLDERGTSTVLVTRSATTDPKRVRFAIDDETANRKRRQRNLRKNILQKSAEQRLNDSDDGPSSSGSPSVPSSPRRSSQRTVESPPKSHSRRHGSRLRKNHLASFVGSTNY